MTTESEREHLSVLVVDTAARIVFATGIFQHAATTTAVVQRWRREAGESSRRVLSVMAAGQELTVVALECDGGCVFTCLSRGTDHVLFDFVATVPFAGDILQHLLTNPYEALTVVDAEGMVRYLSPVHRRFFGLAPGEGIGRHVTEVIENTRLHEVAKTGKAEIGHVQEMRGKTRVVTRVPIHDQAGRLVGAIGQVMFRGPEHLQSLSAEVSRLRSEVAFYRREFSSLRNKTHGLDQIVGHSRTIRRLKDEIVKVAPLDVPVLLIGESGTGKELVAHALHLLSMRRGKPMVLVNAAALPATLVESELFGYEPGAFTGAERKGRKGKFEQADQSTLFFDEIGDMPLEIQVKLLRVLQDGMFERVGGERGRSSSFRLISASNRDFQRMIAEGQFRLDLYYRISAVTLHVPPLRERLEDIPLLVDSALNAFAARHGAAPKKVADATIEHLQTHPWPGNVRQLVHTVERGAIFAEGDVIEIKDFGLSSTMARGLKELMPLVPREDAAAFTKTGGSVREAVSDLEGVLIRQAMTKFGGNKLRVAAELGISRSYLYKRLAEMGTV